MNKRILLYLFLFPILFGMATEACAQLTPVTIFTRVKKLPARKARNFEKGCGKAPYPTNKKLNEYWVAYSEGQDVITYHDPFGREEFGTLKLLQPVLIIQTKNKYCKILQYDPQILDPDGASYMIPFIKKKRYRLINRKAAVYLGWVPEDKLVHTGRPVMCPSNMVPTKYMLGVSDPATIVQRDSFLRADSVFMYPSRGFRKKPGKLLPLGEWVYVYRRNDRPAQSLIGTVPKLDPDSIQGTFGWVSNDMLLPQGQNEILIPNNDEFYADWAAKNKKEYKYPVHWTNVINTDFETHQSKLDLRTLPFTESGGWFLPSMAEGKYAVDSANREVTTHIPLNIVDMTNIHVYNCIGEPFNFQRYLDLRKQLKKINIVLVFEDGKLGKQELRSQISSFQNVIDVITSPGLRDYEFNYSAVGYMGRWLSDTLQWTPSFVDWLEFVQHQAEDTTVKFATTEHVMLMGLREGARYLQGHENENNIVIVIGSKINVNTFPKLYSSIVPMLADVSASLLFLQPKTGRGEAYTDYVLQAKRILKDVADSSAVNRKRIIVENSMVRTKNRFRFLDDCGNGYLFDFPNASMQKGGVFFPNVGDVLCPDLLEWVLDTIFLQIRKDNVVILKAIKNKFGSLGKLQNRANPQLLKILKEQGIEGLPQTVTTAYDDQFWVEVKARLEMDEPESKPYQPGYFIREQEFQNVLKSLRRLVIPAHRRITRKERRNWYRELRRNYDYVNQFFQKKRKAGKIKLAELIFMNTGLPVVNDYFKQLTLKDIKNRKKVEQEDLLPQIEKYYQDIYRLEQFPSINPHAIVTKGEQTYYIIPTKVLP